MNHSYMSVDVFKWISANYILEEEIIQIVPYSVSKLIHYKIKSLIFMM